MLFNSLISDIFTETVQKYIYCEVTHTAVVMVLIAETIMFGDYELEVKGW